MSRLTSRQSRTPLNIQRRVWLSLILTLGLVTGCQGPPAAPTSDATVLPATSAAGGGTGSTPGISPAVPSPSPQATQIVPIVTAAPPQATQGTSRPSQALLEQNALDVAVYQPGDAKSCNLPDIAAPADLTTSVQVFFGCTPTTGPVLPAVPARQVEVPSGTDARQAALRALLTGPTSAEKTQGYLSNFGAQSENVNFKVDVLDGGLAVVDFDPAIRKVEFIFVSNMDATQIVATLGQFPEVKRVAILIGGQLLCQVQGEC